MRERERERERETQQEFVDVLPFLPLAHTCHYDLFLLLLLSIPVWFRLGSTFRQLLPTLANLKGHIVTNNCLHTTCTNRSIVANCLAPSTTTLRGDFGSVDGIYIKSFFYHTFLLLFAHHFSITKVVSFKARTFCNQDTSFSR